MNSEGQEDRDYWNDKYSEASCLYHGEDDMWYDEDQGEWICSLCDNDEYDDAQAANEEAYTYG